MVEQNADERRPSRREVLAWSVQLAAMCSLASLPGSRLLADETVIDEAWASVTKLGPDIWAVISKPLAEKPDYRTLCNGGIVAGKDRVLAIEGFASPEGAAWVGETARQLTGRWPTDVVVTHFHVDHVGGLGGFAKEGQERPQVRMTARTRELVNLAAERNSWDPDAARAQFLADATVLDPDKPTDLDLGGRTVHLHPRGGHTPSDVSVELDEPSLVFFGDLVWNQMFPNCKDATPTELSKSVRAALRKRPTVYVPGHGPLADQTAVGDFLVLIDHVEEAARAAFTKGMSPEEAAETLQLPEPVRGWHRFQETYYLLAMRAWYRELGSAQG